MGSHTVCKSLILIKMTQVMRSSHSVNAIKQSFLNFDETINPHSSFFICLNNELGLKPFVKYQFLLTERDFIVEEENFKIEY